MTVGPKGRVVIPAPIRRELGIADGTELVAMVDDGAVVMMPRPVAKARLRALFAHVRGSLADELIAERRREAQDEDRP
ncbi:MAG TPA: AbrB/MazE/SpoVT family DNA-binding domain-containing protein [Candidatus Limnocylindria bacterium]